MENKVENNIPIFRAEINFERQNYLNPSDFEDSKYHYGCGVSKCGTVLFCENGDQFEIVNGTASIHFSDMIASDSDRLLSNGEKDLRIFASLQKDGRGGDNVEYKLNDWKKAISVCRYKDKQIVYAQNEVKITGIKQ